MPKIIVENVYESDSSDETNTESIFYKTEPMGQQQNVVLEPKMVNFLEPKTSFRTVPFLFDSFNKLKPMEFKSAKNNQNKFISSHSISGEDSEEYFDPSANRKYPNCKECRKKNSHRGYKLF